MEAVKKESKVSQLWNKVKTKIISILKNKSILFSQGGGGDGNGWK